MSDFNASENREISLPRRLEAGLLRLLPAYITPLRFRIILGYLLVLLLAIYGWEQIAAAWRYIVAMLAPAIALLSALLALKIGVVIVSLVTLLIALVKFFFGFLMVVLKPGILKAILIPQIMSLFVWLHRKSARLQVVFKSIYDRIKGAADRLMSWWSAQNRTDKILLSGFLIPLLVILAVVFVVERAAAVFAIKKLTEQVVQKTTKFVIKHFHKVPVVGSIPSNIASGTRKLTVKKDREDVVEDFKSLADELYEPEDTNVVEEGGRQEPNQ